MPCRAADGYFGETAIRSLIYPQPTDHQWIQQTSTMLLHSNQNRSHDDIQYKNNRHRNQDMYLRQNGLQQRQPVFLLACSRIRQNGAVSHQRLRSNRLKPVCCSFSLARQAGQRSRRRRSERSECCMRPARQIIDLGRASSFVDRSPTIAASEGVNAVSVAFFPGEPWAIRMEKRTATNAVSWSELRRTLPFFPESHGRSAWHNEKQ